jgi:nucleoside 2-deoxyribosyltransferase
MPFRPELHFFYLYIQNYLKSEHGIECERGDAKVLTIPLLEKIKKQIADADMIIADMSGRNPNVFYELGLADALGKKVVLITQDVDNVPTDVR